MLTNDTPESVGLDPMRWQAALDLAAGWCDRDLIPAMAIVIGRSGKTTGVHRFGRQKLDAGSPPLRDDAIFLVASITKPIVATAALLLIERGQLTLGDRLSDIVPEFGGSGRYGITIRHLLTHTSGLPDMLENNRQLREEGAPLSQFVEEVCKVTPNFAAGRGVQYQSMGFAMLGEVIGRIAMKPCADFVRDELFHPLEMTDSALGATDDWFEGPNPQAERIAEIRLPPEQHDAARWCWNSRYWRSMGTPWGGLLTTPEDLARFAQMMLDGGTAGSKQLLAKASIAAATHNQLTAMPDVPEVEKLCRPWGLGWRLDWPAHTPNFGDLLGTRSYGHWGATGTLLWIDPEQDAFAIVLTTQPQEPRGYYLSRISNAIAAALV